jgi:hypothetical protein
MKSISSGFPSYTRSNFIGRVQSDVKFSNAFHWMFQPPVARRFGAELTWDSFEFGCAFLYSGDDKDGL